MQLDPVTHVLLDPSLLLDPRAFQRLRGGLAVAELEEQYRFFVPGRFVDLLEGRERPDLSYFVRPEASINLSDLRIELETSRYFAIFRPEVIDLERHITIESGLRRAVRRPWVSDILFEEWVFLQEESWILSRIRKPFGAFIRAGAMPSSLVAEHSIAGLGEPWTFREMR